MKESNTYQIKFITNLALLMSNLFNIVKNYDDIKVAYLRCHKTSSEVIVDEFIKRVQPRSLLFSDASCGGARGPRE